MEMMPLFSVLRVLRVFWYLYFQEKVYIYTYHLRHHRHMGPCGFFFVERRAAKITEYTEYRKWMTPYRKM